ncbi:3-oxoacyl-[acyl-carrier-protein] synthase III [Chromobacterium violaceum]|uniref:3-oxoacyl-ACP synthase n=2 Tax=Chromobacterium violaceum TaxID=536 RepID=A0A202BG72_CHRVL|nr:ketoacyl-ACP synthase III family protein [Chromobacterium violaceum]AAQ58481.1 probable 3-oxoacyl-[acyl-carrier-protein] synthase III [Chromobacterium violaceum ATCC 12472]KJH69059.1 3-oxoacyl-ACP synthase [Chromobacterium violaceum]KMN50649.1 3-oxoacyl-ACP synthase [Chromobacterium violaceum]KMN87145.1 3-oxoacyl-ACP synthase [Chromobacterium violaceum]KMN89731.1 3-oxoacyl-ACP synthase [Chromobacterium violaceum]
MPGIATPSICYPLGRVEARQLHQSSGAPLDEVLNITRCDGFPALGEGEQSWELAASAARDLLRREGIAPDQISHVIYAGTGCWDRPFWSPSAKIAQAIGIHGAHCFEVTNFCNAAWTAINLACDKLDSGRADLVLVVTADQLSRLVDRDSADSLSLFNFGDAAAAVLVKRGGERYRLLHSAMRTDPGWVDYYAGAWRDGKVRVERQPHRRGLAQAYLDNFALLVQRTLDALGRSLAEVRYLLINHGDEDMHRSLLARLDLSEERTVFNYHRLGHMGSADTLIALEQLEREQQLQAGDLILLASSAMGFSWGITAVEYQA